MKKRFLSGTFSLLLTFPRAAKACVLVALMFPPCIHSGRLSI